MSPNRGLGCPWLGRQGVRKIYDIILLHLSFCHPLQFVIILITNCSSRAPSSAPVLIEAA